MDVIAFIAQGEKSSTVKTYLTDIKLSYTRSVDTSKASAMLGKNSISVVFDVSQALDRKSKTQESLQY
ncbi:uncharacterized protein RAG0_10219 [Rhynchosporium agropyri]|uniref:Uncharacterized protein n=1 Tax=Rhynchosporium agropyri TaxID=914238 RepID=A0A1E1KYZ9_9HELO|nr:uncharacterized protein RAG0_10219 [Rhynchosporium agropyri]